MRTTRGPTSRPRRARCRPAPARARWRSRAARRARATAARRARSETGRARARPGRGCRRRTGSRAASSRRSWARIAGRRRRSARRAVAQSSRNTAPCATSQTNRSPRASNARPRQKPPVEATSPNGRRRGHAVDLAAFAAAPDAAVAARTRGTRDGRDAARWSCRRRGLERSCRVRDVRVQRRLEAHLRIGPVVFGTSAYQPGRPGSRS